MTTLGVECYFIGMQADHDLPTVAHYSYRRACCVEYDMLPICQKDFSYFTGPISFYPVKSTDQNESKVNPQTSRRDQTSSQQSLKELLRYQRRRPKARNCDARICWGIWKRPKTGKCLLKSERANWHPSLCP